MIVFFMAMVVSGLLVGGICIVLSRLVFKRIRSSVWRTKARWATAGAAPICFFFLLSPTLLFLWSWTVVEGTDVQRDEYRGKGPRLPLTAKGITYSSDHGGTDAVFSIEESAFVAWTEQQGWGRSEVRGEQTACLHRLGMSRSVTDGILVLEVFHRRGTGVRLLFDRATGLCYYRYSAY